jgi:DNA-binding MarR family transcriptional regulator
MTADASTTATTATLPVLLWLRFIRVYQKADRIMAGHFRCEGVSMAQFEVLARVGAAEGLTQQQLADSLLVTKGNVCQLLDRMEQAGLLVRRQAGRANRLSLTDKGRELYARIVPEHEDVIAQVFSVLSGQEQEQLLGLLRTVDRALS